MHKKSWKLTDSQVTLHWINCTKSVLKMFVRNGVVEITCLTDRSSWWYVNSKNMIADLGTRKCVKSEEVRPNSPWIQGHSWMSERVANFPIKTIDEIILSNKEKSEANREKVVTDFPCENVKCLTPKYVPNEVRERYIFSKYLIDPNKFRFRIVLRILALVFLFIQKIQKKCNKRGTLFKFLKTCDFSMQQNTHEKGEYLVSPINCLLVQLAQVKWQLCIIGGLTERS